MDTGCELQQAVWELIADMERARLQGDDDQVLVLERIAWRLVGVLDGSLSGVSDCWISKC